MDKNSTTKIADDKSPQLTIEEAYKLALEHFHNGQFEKVDQICTAITNAVPDHIDALNLHGVLAQRHELHEKAIELFSRAVAIDDKIAQLHYNLGLSHFNLGQKNPAISCYNRAIALAPEFCDAHYNLAIVLQEQNRLDEAIASYKKVLSIKADYASHHNLGILYQLQNRLEDAKANYQKAIELKPDFVEAYCNLGNVLKEQGRVDESYSAFKQAVKINPDDLKAHYNLGVIQQNRKEFLKAASSFKKAVAIKPDFAKAHYNLAIVLEEQNRLDEAIISYKQAVAIEPDFIDANYNYAVVLQKQNRFDEAVANYKKVIKLNPEYSNAHYNIACIYQKQDLLVDAVNHYKKAIAIREDFAAAYNNMGIAKKEQSELKEAVLYFKKAIEIDPEFINAHNNLIFCTDVFADNESDLFQIERIKWAKQHSEPLKATWTPPQNSPDPDKVLRIGYVGADFWRHSAAYIFGPCILHHNPEQFKTFCYVGNTKEDALTKELKKSSTSWLITKHMDDKALAKQIQKDGIDILVDLAGHTPGNRLLTFARKPAPVQITAWGYPHGTNMAAMDYLFADPIFIPQSQRNKYSEQIIDLPCVIHMYADTPFAQVTPPPVLENGYITFGAFNRIEKYNSDVYSLWAEILRRIPTAKLLIKTGTLHSPNYIADTKAFFKKEGISPERLILLLGSTPKREHQETHSQVDIMLDPFPHNGGMTTLESLRMGVPVLTHEQKTRCATSASILHVLDLDKWRAASDKDYVDKAVNFAMDVESLVTLRQELRGNFEKSVVGNSQLYVTHVEKTYRQLWKKWCEKIKQS
ncbi:MAG: tetratricopeptide repeat protein [Magnetococcales bacterium]|nr:tetratricopeptide repeat protein [Magnetococcales bacterium]